jgi:hypothetical protein
LFLDELLEWLIWYKIRDAQPHMTSLPSSDIVEINKEMLLLNDEGSFNG